MQATCLTTWKKFQPAKNGMFLSGADNNLKVYVCADIAASSEK